MYPAAYDAVNIDRVGFSAANINQLSISMSGEIGRGGSEEWGIIAMPDAVADAYALDPDMEIISSTEADTLMQAWRIQNKVSEERIDADVINAIRAKREAGIPETQEDLDALDVTKPDRGITKARKPIGDVVPNIIEPV